MFKRKAAATSQGFFLSHNPDFVRREEATLSEMSPDDDHGLSTSLPLGSCSLISSVENNMTPTKSGSKVIFRGQETTFYDFLGQEKLKNVARKAKKQSIVLPPGWLSLSPPCSDDQNVDLRKAKKPRLVLPPGWLSLSPPGSNDQDIDFRNAKKPRIVLPPGWLSLSPPCSDYVASSSGVVNDHMAPIAAVPLDCVPPQPQVAPPHVNPQDVQWSITKKLTASDCNGLRRLYLTEGELIKEHIISGFEDETMKAKAETTKGVCVHLYDCDTGFQTEVKVKKVPSKRCYVLAGKWRCDIANRRQLKEKDKIGLFWDQPHQRLLFSVLKVAVPSANTEQSLIVYDDVDLCA